MVLARVLIFTSGQGVHGFTLDPGVGEFLLSHENVKMPIKREKSMPSMREIVRSGNQKFNNLSISSKTDDKATGRPYSSRYSGCLAADVHRILLGGRSVFVPRRNQKSQKANSDCSMKRIH